jgi:hypothetical protein
VREVLRASEAIARETGNASIKHALERFLEGEDGSLVREIRDIFGHFDDYARDEGKLQRKTPLVSQANDEQIEQYFRNYVSGSPSESHTAGSNIYIIQLSRRHVLDVFITAAWALYLVETVEKAGV